MYAHGRERERERASAALEFSLTIIGNVRGSYSITVRSRRGSGKSEYAKKCAAEKGAERNLVDCKISLIYYVQSNFL